MKEAKRKRAFIYKYLKKIAEIYNEDYKKLKANYLKLNKTERIVYDYRIIEMVKEFEINKGKGMEIYESIVKNIAK
jgi:hypothetical protein